MYKMCLKKIELFQKWIYCYNLMTFVSFKIVYTLVDTSFAVVSPYLKYILRSSLQAF